MFYVPQTPYHREITRLLIVVGVTVAISYPRHDTVKIGVGFAVEIEQPGAVLKAAGDVVVFGARYLKTETVVFTARGEKVSQAA